MKRQKLIAIFIFILGMVIPFIDDLVLIEMFYLLVLLIILFCASTALLIGYLIWDRSRLKEFFLFILAIPLFILGQFFSSMAVDKVQRARSEQTIKEIESILAQTGQIPADYPIKYGIKFSRLKSKNEFRLSYSKGFMVTMYYTSVDKKWRNNRWYD